MIKKYKKSLTIIKKVKMKQKWSKKVMRKSCSFTRKK